MTLSQGSKLGPYEILAPIGAGGMGEVYRARDTRLERTVAVKVLPQHLSSSPESRQRFEREAKTISQLSHPHICALYDVGREGETEYLVMELLEGETLADRLGRGALPVEQTLRYGQEIADALDKAHRQGIVHRDLKPGNVMLTKSGVKLLDFGLAKAIEPARAQTALTSLPTAMGSPNLTQEGSILGTFQYMAPEQLEGREADARTDIFAFGAVLYEMATGRKAFAGKSQASLIGAILRDEPAPISVVQPMTPPALDRVVKTCLAKDPEDRWQTARDVLLQLKWIQEGGSQAGVPAPVVARRRIRERLGWILAGVLALALGAALVFFAAKFRRLSGESGAIRFVVPPPEKAALGTALALSPDGHSLVFVAGSEGKTVLWLRPLGSLDARPLKGSDDAAFPFWSPDSRFVGFAADGKLRRIDVSGGLVQTLCDVSDFRGGSWSRSGVIVFAPDTTSVIYQVSAEGGSPKPVTEMDKSRKETSHRWPRFLPDGKHFVFLARSGEREKEGLNVGSLESKERKFLWTASSSADYAPPGYILYVREGTLVAQRFDAGGLRPLGEAVSVAENVFYVGSSGPTGYAAFSAAENGVLAFRTGNSATFQLVWFDRSGHLLSNVGAPGQYAEPWLSPDGKRIAIGRSDPKTGEGDIWLMELSRGTLSRFTFDPANEESALWSPDGSRIVFSSNRSGFYDLYVKDASGAGAEKLLLKTGTNKWADDWTLDGRFLVYENLDPKTKFDLWVLPMTGEPKPRPLLQTEFNEAHAQVSPDGKWIAYTSDESGRPEVFVQSFPEPGGKWQISANGGDQASWRADGKEIFYRAQDKKLMAVAVQRADESFEAGVPQALFETRTPPIAATGVRNFHVASPDGQRFLVNSLVEETTRNPITVIVNWPSELKR